MMLNEHTLCGDAYDVSETERGWENGAMVAATKRTVTCPECVAIIRECKAARI